MMAAMKRADMVIALVLWVLSCLGGSWYVRSYMSGGGQWDGFFANFGAAVSLACGRGFVDASAGDGAGYDPQLSAFLAGKSDEISCRDLPDVTSGEPTFMQRLYRYLITAVALVWTIRGRLTWSGLVPLYGALYASTIVAAYAIFRQLLSTRTMAVLASVALAVSSIHLSHLPAYRDYAKAPFILTLIAVLVRLARSRELKGMLMWAAVFGLVLGIGLGFRNDLLVNVPPFLFVVFLWTGRSPLKDFRKKIAAVALAGGVFVTTGWPVLQAYARGSNSGHAALSGVMSNTYDEALGIRPSIYDWASVFQDEYTYAVVSSYGYRVHGAPPVFGTGHYDRTASEYLMQISRHTPADILAHAYASTMRILEMPFTVGLYANGIPSRAERNEFARILYGRQTWLLGSLAGTGVTVAAAALTIAGMSSLAAASTFLLLLLYYAGYPILQFQHRHYFHLEFIEWLALAFLVERAGAWLQALFVRWRHGGRPAIDRVAVIRGLAFFVGAAVILAGTLAILRSYQQRHLTALFTTYANAPREWIETSPSHLWDQRRRESGETPVSAQYLIAEFSGQHCGAARIPVTFRYTAREPMVDFSRTIVVVLDDNSAPTRVFFPAYYYEHVSHFERVEMPVGYEHCLVSLSRVADLSATPLLIDLTLRPAWRNDRLFQTLSTVERDRRMTAAYFTRPDSLVVTTRDLRAVAPAPGEPPPWIVRKRPTLATARLLQFEPTPVKRGSLLVAKGEARSGAFRVGLVDGGRWVTSVGVTSGGPFVVALEVPEDGRFAIAVDANLADRWPAKYVGHRLGPLLQWIPGATFWVDLTIRQIGFAPAG